MRGYRTTRLATALAAAALATGCAAGGQNAEIDGDAASSQRVTVTVENNNWQDATVYLAGAGPLIRLGTVNSMNRERFTVPASVNMSGTVRLVADLIGSTTRRATDPIMVNPGGEVSWVLENHLPLSSYRVR